jgi:hypothetical protein
VIKRILVVLGMGALLAGSAFAQPCAFTTAAANITSTCGNVGIGTGTTPAAKLEVNGTVMSTPVTGAFSVGPVVAPSGYQFFATNTAASTSTGFQMKSNYFQASTTYMVNVGDFGAVLSQNREPQFGAFLNSAASPNQKNAVALTIGDVTRGRMFQVANFPGSAESPRMMIDYNGNVGIGTTTPAAMLDVNGSINVTGNINAKYQDVAEWVPSAMKIEPGTVVILDPVRSNEVMPSRTAYDTSAAGVISAKPGISLGEASASKVQVATSGRVHVKVDASKNPVKIGDLLVTSDKPGMAMKSIPVNVNGIQMHRPGTLIGKALEPLPKGEGEILVLLSMQ